MPRPATWPGRLPLVMMPRAAARASGWPGFRITARRWGGGIRWSTCSRWRSARLPRPGTTRRPRSRSGRPAAPQDTLAVLGGRRDPWARRVRAPSARTFARVFAGLDAEAFNVALYGYLATLPAGPAGALPAVTRHEREQRRAARAEPDPPGQLEQAAADGKTIRGAVRPDGSRVHLLSVLDVATGCVRAQREIDAKTNEIPQLAPALAQLDLTGAVVTLDALHTQAETARYLAGHKQAYYLMITKGNQPGLLAAVASALAGPDKDFADVTWTETGTGHGRRERRSVRTAPAAGIAWPPGSSVSAATPGQRTAPGPARRSPSASPACPPTWQAPAT